MDPYNDDLTNLLLRHLMRHYRGLSGGDGINLLGKRYPLFLLPAPDHLLYTYEACGGDLSKLCWPNGSEEVPKQDSRGAD